MGQHPCCKEDKRLEKKSGFIWVLLTVGFAALSAILGIQLYQGGQTAGAAKLEDPTAVAVVNGETITKAQLYDRMIDRVGKDAVDELIKETLVTQAAKAANVTVSDAEVKAELDKIKSNFGSDAEFEMVLAQQGFTLDELNRQIKFHVTLKKLVEPRVADKLTDAALEEHFNANKESYATQKEEVHARHILVETREAAEQVIARIKAGEDFAAVAKEVSTEPAAKESGGDLGFFGRGQMVPEFEEAAFNLPVGQLSEPVQSQFGWHVIEVLEHKQPVVPTFAEVKAKVREDVLNREIGGQIDGYLQELEEKAEIQNTLAEPGA